MYPSRRTVWKKTMQVLQTAGLPPRTGSRIFPSSGWTMNSSVAEKKIAHAKSRDIGAEILLSTFYLLPSTFCFLLSTFFPVALDLVAQERRKFGLVGDKIPDFAAIRPQIVEFFLAVLRRGDELEQ